MRNKVRSIFFAIGWYLTAILWFYVLIPLLCIVEPEWFVAFGALWVGVIGLPLLFMGVRHFWKKKERWNKWGTIVYIGLNFLTAAYVGIAILFEELNSPFSILINTEFVSELLNIEFIISDQDISFMINCLIIVSPIWFGSLLAIELLTAGIRRIFRLYRKVS